VCFEHINTIAIRKFDKTGEMLENFDLEPREKTSLIDALDSQVWRPALKPGDNWDSAGMYGDGQSEKSIGKTTIEAKLIGIDGTEIDSDSVQILAANLKLK